MKVKKKELRSFMVPVAILIFVFLLFKLVFLFGYVPTESMEPTIEHGSYIVGIRIYSSLEPGDVIVFRHEGKLLVKRIAASSGDTIEKNGMQVIIPEGRYYVLGDNAKNSYDSRYWAEPFVAAEDVVAKLVFW